MAECRGHNAGRDSVGANDAAVIYGAALCSLSSSSIVSTFLHFSQMLFPTLST